MIKTHKELAQFIKDKSILHLNSLGKDSALTLEWLVNYAKPKKIVSVNFRFLVKHPMDDVFFDHQKKKYSGVEFIQDFNAHEVSNIGQLDYQSPIDTMTEFNHWEFGDFSMAKHAEEIMRKNGCDYMCVGNSKYESVARAMKFYKKGLLIEWMAYPLGLMTKNEVLTLIQKTKIKVHPVYRIAQSTLDYPSYYKMRSSFIAYPGYFEEVLKFYPMLALDKYRYEVLMKGHFEEKK